MKVGGGRTRKRKAACVSLDESGLNYPLEKKKGKMRMLGAKPTTAIPKRSRRREKERPGLRAVGGEIFAKKYVPWIRGRGE